MFSMREILVFAVGMVLATVLTVMGTFYFSRITFCCMTRTIPLSNKAASSRRKRSSDRSRGFSKQGVTPLNRSFMDSVHYAQSAILK